MNPKRTPSEAIHSIISYSDRSSLLADPLWTVEDVAAYLKLQPETIRSLARQGKLPAIKLGKVWRFQSDTIHLMLTHQG